MNRPPDCPDSEPTPELIEAAIEALHRGSPEFFDRLLDPIAGGSSGICGLFAEMTSPAALNVSPPNIPGYTIDRVVAAGGMGVVFAATQVGTGRLLAIKVIRGGFGGGGAPMDRLFRREVETLLRLRHPNIAELHDAGTTSDGAPFFAMEFIEGRTLKDEMRLAENVDLRSDDGRDSIRRFIDICRAMNHAHQRGVIHCDLKPTNVMIASDGTPKVLDFGLSRLNDPDVSTIAAASSHRLVGTIAYMSPEQVSGPIGELDIRSDVYSLGVMLYELVCGQPPYRASGSAIPAAIRTICETEPTRPASVRPILKGDLDAIVMKALEKNPDQRYQSAGELADDLERSLRGEPIEARSDRFYLLRRTLYRYRVQARVAMAFVLVLVVATAVSTWFWFRVQRESDRAEASGNISLAVVSDLMSELDEVASRLSHRREFNSKIADHLEKLLPIVPRNGETQSILADLNERTADVLVNLGDYEAAAIKFHEALTAIGHESPRAARIYRKLARIPGKKDAESLFKKALQYTDEPREQCLAAIDYARFLIDKGRLLEALQIIDDHPCEILRSRGPETRAVILMKLGRNRESISAFRHAIELADASLEHFPDNPVARIPKLSILSRLGIVLMMDAQYDAALNTAHDAIDLGNHLYWVDPNDVEVIQLIAMSCDTEVSAYSAKKEYDKALEAIQRQLIWAQRLLARGSGNPLWRCDLGQTIYRRGTIHFYKGANDDARTDFLEALAIFDSILEDDPENGQVLSRKNQTLVRLDLISKDAGNWDAALDYRRQLISLTRRMYDLEPNSVYNVRDYVSAHIALAEAYLTTGQVDQLPELVKSLDSIAEIYEQTETDEAIRRDILADVTTIRDLATKNREAQSQN